MSDGLIERQALILAAVQARLDAVDAPVCRAFLGPGAQVPWDTCCECRDGGEGQAWVVVDRFYPADGLAQDVSAQRCHPSGYAADLTVGVLRCAHTVDDRGEAPSAVTVTGDADKVARDRQAVRDALLCDVLGPDADPGTFRLGVWQPLGPSGGCVGGSWQATIAVPACRCVPLPDPETVGL